MGAQKSSVREGDEDDQMGDSGSEGEWNHRMGA